MPDVGSSFDNVIFAFVKRSTNSIAHSLARALCSLPGFTRWDVIAPAFLTLSLFLDFQ